MAQTSAYASLSAFLLEKVIPKIQYVVPEETKLSRLLDLPKNKGTKIGDKYVLPILIQPAQGATYGGSDAGAFAIETPVSPEAVEAYIKTTSWVQQLDIAQDLIDRMQDGDTSVISSFALTIESLDTQAMFHQELSLLHGSRGIGTIKARTNDSHTTQTFSVYLSAWAPIIWQRMLGAQCDVYNGASKITATTAMTLTSYSLSARTLTFTGTEADMDSIAAGYTIYPRGAYGKMMEGLALIAGSTTSTIHNLSQSTYPGWKSNTQSAGNADISPEVVFNGITTLQNRGVGENLTLFVDPISASKLKLQLAAKAGSKGSNLRYDVNTSTLGYDDQDIKIETHKYMWPGEAIMGDMSVLERIGKGVSFIDLGGGTKNYVMPLNGYHGAYSRAHWNQGLFCREPGRWLKITDIGSATA